MAQREQETNETPEIGRGASVEIAHAAERASDAISRRLRELDLVQAAIETEAAHFARDMRERSDSLQSRMDIYARQCRDVRRQIKDASMRLGLAPADTPTGFLAAPPLVPFG